MFIACKRIKKLSSYQKVKEIKSINVFLIAMDAVLEAAAAILLIISNINCYGFVVSTPFYGNLDTGLLFYR